MAKEYAYYVTGGKIYLVEKDEDTGLFESPSSNITNGIRISSKVTPIITDGSTPATTAGTGVPNTDLIGDFHYVETHPYIERALVNYCKARFAEDRGEIELKEYWMKEFRAMVSRYEDGKVHGARQVFPPKHAIK